MIFLVRNYNFLVRNYNFLVRNYNFLGSYYLPFTYRRIYSMIFWLDASSFGKR